MTHHSFIKQYEGVVPHEVCDWLVGSLRGHLTNWSFVVMDPRTLMKLNINQFTQGGSPLVGIVQSA